MSSYKMETPDNMATRDVRQDGRRGASSRVVLGAEVQPVYARCLRSDRRAHRVLVAVTSGAWHRLKHTERHMCRPV